MPSSYALPSTPLEPIPSTPPTVSSPTFNSETTVFADHQQQQHNQEHTPPHTNSRPPRAIPPSSLTNANPGPRRVAFDPAANRRYYSAPYSLPSSGLGLSGLGEPGGQAERSRHISLALGEYPQDREEYGFMPRARPRGESDLSRPNGLRGSGKGNGFLSLGARADGQGDGLSSLRRCV